MKKIILTIGAAVLAFNAFAQDNAAEAAAMALSQAPEEVSKIEKPKYWNENATFSFGANLTNLDNWAAGGYNTSNLNVNFDVAANYAKDLMTWNNRLQMDYGFLSSSDKKGILQKSNDRLYLESKWAYQTAKGSKFNYTASFDFRSQFTDTPNKYVQDAEGLWVEEGLKSGFLSPAYSTIALGIAWKPAKWFDVNIAPLTGGYTIVTNELLRQTYGMEVITEAVKDGEGNITTPATYKSAMFQFGAQVKANLKLQIDENIKFESQAVVFTDYLNEPYVRINWDNSIDWQLSKYIKLAAKTWMINDPNVVIVAEDGTSTKRGSQWKEFISFNFTYSFNWKN